MNNFFHTAKILALTSCLALVYGATRADDIDIFVGSSGGSAAAQNVMFLVDNSTNWASNATNICASTPSSCPTLPTSPSGQKYNTSTSTGGNELNAIIATMAALYSDPNGV